MLVTIYALVTILDGTVLLESDYGLSIFFFTALNLMEVACQSIVAYICVTMGS